MAKMGNFFKSNKNTDNADINTNAAIISRDSNYDLWNYLNGNMELRDKLKMSPDEYDTFMLKATKPEELKLKEFQKQLIKVLKFVQKQVRQDYKNFKKLERLKASPTSDPRKIAELSEFKLGFAINQSFNSGNINKVENNIKNVISVFYNKNNLSENSKEFREILNEIAEDEQEKKEDENKAKEEIEKEEKKLTFFGFKQSAEKTDSENDKKPEINPNIKKATVSKNNNSNLWKYLKDNNNIRNQMGMSEDIYDLFLLNISKPEKLQSTEIQRQLQDVLEIVYQQISIDDQNLRAIHQIINSTDTPTKQRAFYEKQLEEFDKKNLNLESIRKIANDYNNINDYLSDLIQYENIEIEVSVYHNTNLWKTLKNNTSVINRIKNDLEISDEKYDNNIKKI